ncbi:MAG: flagellar assembly protein A [Burkholderiales bacterium]
MPAISLLKNTSTPADAPTRTAALAALDPRLQTAPAAAVSSFVHQRADGLYVDTVLMQNRERFAAFVERIFTRSELFLGLEYGNFERLLYSPENDASRPKGAVRIANGIGPFQAERRSLYRGVALGTRGEQAEYFFEPVYLEAEEAPSQQPESNPQGAPHRASLAGVGNSQPAKLDFDELIAHFWINGIRFGIDAARIKEALGRGENGRIVVARTLKPKVGKDAGLEDKSRSLRRDNAPIQLANGQVDLCSFGNRFPQARKNELLMKKTAPINGDPGRSMSGAQIAPEPPKDFDLTVLAGPGTRIEKRADGQYIVADMDGFIDIDKASKRICIAEKMVGREGVSIRTTGNLRMGENDFEEFGEVEPHRVVEGRNMSFHADVFGQLNSTGGKVLLEKTFGNGKLRNPGGEVIVLGRASSSLIDAPGGTVTMRLAEACQIFAKRVEIEQAVGCEIIAEEVILGVAEGCNIAARLVKIKRAGSRGGRETLVSILLPNESEYIEGQNQANRDLTEALCQIGELSAAKMELEESKSFVDFLKLQSRFASGKMKLSLQQRTAYDRLAAQFKPICEKYRKVSEELEAVREDHAKADAHLEQLGTAHRQLMAIPLSCEFAAISGETVVQQMNFPDNQIFTETALMEPIRQQLQARNLPRWQLFAGESGKFSWRH